jgi:hypothetical protein
MDNFFLLGLYGPLLLIMKLKTATSIVIDNFMFPMLSILTAISSTQSLECPWRDLIHREVRQITWISSVGIMIVKGAPLR